MRERLVKLMNRAIEGDSCPAETKELFAAWIADKDNTERSIELEAQITPIVKANADKCEICKEIASLSQYLIKNHSGLSVVTVLRTISASVVSTMFWHRAKM